MTTENQYLKTEIDKWREEVAHSKTTIRYLEDRKNAQAKRICQLEALLNEGSTL